MQNWKKVLLLLLVLMPSFFFLSKALMDSTVELKAGVLEITGAGGLETKVSDFESLELISALPELSGTGSYSLGLVKKGNFIRTSDQAKVRVIKNNKEQFIHYTTADMEVYLSLSTKEQTLELFQDLSEEYLGNKEKIKQ